MIVEVCANSLQSAVNAQKAGADRIELCTELGVGGITPSYGMLQTARELIRIPVHVLIRPRSGDFTYTTEEFDLMAKDIECCASLGFDGIVSGILQPDLQPDLVRTAALLATGQGMHFTFHRAFDWIPQPMDALGRLEAIGVKTILTSGQAASAMEGLELLTDLEKAAGNTAIMPGGGINPENALAFKEKGFKAIHLSAALMIKTLAAQPVPSMNTMAFLSDDHRPESQFTIIREVVSCVK
jgi:copper homeostasis protein